MCFLMILTVAALAGPPLFAQRGFGPAVRSPEVAADGSVTFRLRAPEAEEVSVAGLGEQLPMTKDDNGIWSVTSDLLEPDIYTYSFSVDGLRINDPGNPLFKTAYGSAGQSLFHVPGDVVWEPAPGIGRGAVARHFYHSDVAGDDRDFWVYAPAGYDPSREEPYPVLYLFHGIGDESSTWIGTGAANVILDNLIAEGEAVPMLMVNTLGYGNSGGPAEAMSLGMIPGFARTILEEVVPRVEDAYNVSVSREDRAIAGLSMGGAEALYTGLNHLDRFAWIGSFSGAFVMWPRESAGPGEESAAGRGRGGHSMEDTDFERSFPNLDSSANSEIRLLWIACGADDGLNDVNQQFKSWLRSKQIRLTDLEIPGFAHVWPLWRQNLAEFAPLLFQAEGE